MSNTNGMKSRTKIESSLRDARAESLQVVAIFVDIRGFSAFAVRGSFPTAYYLKSLYTEILANRFADCDFHKLTGDGVMLIHHLPSDDARWPEFICSLVERSRKLVSDFPNLLEDDYTVTKDRPKLLGIGLARGEATRLHSGRRTIDYTGPCLNLAARLMDKARPSGVVFVESHAEQVLGDLLGELEEDSICIRGISDDVPMKIYTTPEVIIQQHDREPNSDLRRTWGAWERVSIADVRKQQTYAFRIPRRPHDDEVAEVRVTYDEYESGKKGDSYYFEEAGKIGEDEYGLLVRLNLTRTKNSIASSPEKTEPLGLFRVQQYVRFRPFIRPIEE
jgi:class 3 adenylate cyclase